MAKVTIDSSITVNNVAVNNQSELEEQLLAHNLTPEEAEQRIKTFKKLLATSKDLKKAKEIRIEINEEEGLFEIYVDNAPKPLNFRTVKMTAKEISPKEQLIAAIDAEKEEAELAWQKALEIRREEVRRNSNSHSSRKAEKAKPQTALVPVKQSALTTILNKLKELFSKMHLTKKDESEIVRRVSKEVKEWNEHIDRFKQEKLEPTLEAVLEKLAKGKDALAVKAQEALEAIDKTLDAEIKNQDKKAKIASRTVAKSYAELKDLLNDLQSQRRELIDKIDTLEQMQQEKGTDEEPEEEQKYLARTIASLKVELAKVENEITKIENSKEYKELDAKIEKGVRRARVAKDKKEVLEAVRGGIDR